MGNLSRGEPNRAQTTVGTAIGGRSILALVSGVALVAAACTGGTGATAGPGQSGAPSGAPASSPPEELVDISYSFDWKPDADWAAMIWADELGYFAEEGVNVEWVEGNGSSATLPLLGAGEFDLAQVAAPPLVLSVPEGIPVTVVGMQVAESPNVLICNETIETPADLVGATYADQVGEFEHALWLAWAQANDVDVNEVNVVPATGESSDILFIEGQLDCFIAFWTDARFLLVQDERPGEENLFYIRDSLDIAGLGTAANNSFLQENPDAVRGFLRGLARGAQHMVNNRDATIDMMLEKMPQHDRPNMTHSVDSYIDLWASEIAMELGILGFTGERWEATREALVGGGLMEDGDISGLYSTEYLPDPPILP